MTEGYAPMRSWSRSIAGKLQIAFGLIAALTVVATAVALFQFIRADNAMQGLSSRSIPAVKLSLSLETSAAEVAAATALLARSNYEFQRIERAATMRERMAKMNDRLARLRGLLGASPEVERLAGLVRAVEADADVLDQAIREKVKVGARREQVTEMVGPTVDAIGRMLAPISDRIVFDTSLALEDESAVHNGDLKTIADRELPRLQAVYDMRTYIQVVGSLLSQVSAQEYIEEIPPLYDQFGAAQERLDRTSLALIKDSEGVDAGAVADLRTEMQRLFDLGQGADGLFSLRTRELQSTAAARARQNDVQRTADEMGLALNALVTTTERDATQTTALTSSQISTARTWLIILALASLAIAGLIMWLFVHRYIVARLKALSSSMLAVAGGNLQAPIPEARPDEIGDMSRALSVFRDNAREIRSAKEEADRARAAAEEASRTKSAFLANMSHELRTPLNAIIGYSEMLLEDAADRGDEASETDLRKIQTAGKHLLGLINDILDLSKIEAGRIELYVETVDLAKLATELRTMVEPLLAKNANALVIDCPADIGVFDTDLTKLRQSLLNLLSNAAKFTKDGKIFLEIARTRDAAGAPQLRFRVRDTGIGMTEEQIGRLFQAFTQADSSTTRNFGGTGLGLAITRHFCQMLGGSIVVESTPGEGSIFTITLPENVAVTTQQAPALPAISGPASGSTILVVDDDPVVHEVLAATLTKEGFRVVHARNGTDALRLARETQPDAVTLDVMMPQVDGWSVLGILKSDPALAHIPVIMLTIVDNRGLGFSLGASEFMTKPIDRGRLVALLNRFAAPARGRLVLIVDDDNDVRTLLRHSVEGAGLVAAEAANGRIALDMLRKEGVQPALVLLDLMMPEIDGFGFLDAIRADPALADLPVVVLTAKELTAEEKAALAERTMHVFSKGAQSVDSFGRTLATMIRRESAAA